MSRSRTTKANDSPPAAALPSLTERRLKAALTSQKKENRQLEAAWLRAEQRMEELLAAVVLVTPVKFQSTPGDSRKKKNVRVVLSLADWQIGMKVLADEIQGYNEYSLRVARRRLTTMCDKLDHWLGQHAQVYNILEIVVLGLGDLLEGTLRLESCMFVEFPPPTQAIHAGYLLAEVLNRLSAWGPVRYEGLNSDNHARLFKKPMSQGRGVWSYNPVLHAMATAATQSNARITVNAHNPIKVDVRVGNHIFLIEHGNDIYTWMGIPAYGIERAAAREARRRAEAGLPPFNYYVFGHWHQRWVSENVMIMPALCGTTPYDHSKGRRGIPGQHVCLVDQRHGIFDELRMDL